MQARRPKPVTPVRIFYYQYEPKEREFVNVVGPIARKCGKKFTDVGLLRLFKTFQRIHKRQDWCDIRVKGKKPPFEFTVTTDGENLVREASKSDIAILHTGADFETDDVRKLREIEQKIRERSSKTTLLLDSSAYGNREEAGRYLSRFGLGGYYPICSHYGPSQNLEEIVNARLEAEGFLKKTKKRVRI